MEGPTELKSVILVQLAVQDTVHLHGKYVYQITIRMPSDSAYGKIDIPLHGILYIGKNINMTIPFPPPPLTKQNESSRIEATR